MNEINHSRPFRVRRFWNWFPMGLTYALLYMGRYNLTVAKNALGDLMTKEDFGIIFGAGTATYAIAFLLNGPITDRIGGRRGMLIASFGAAIANLALGLYLMSVVSSGDPTAAPLRLVFAILYSINMYFQSFGAVSIVKVNAHWFHVKERGGFSGIFGTMISSGIFLAFTVNSWIMSSAKQFWPGQPLQWIVFLLPAVLLLAFFFIELMLLKDRPGLAGFDDFNTGDASSDDTDETPLPTKVLFKKIFTNPIIMTVAAIEFCTGVLRNGVMHWFPIYVKEIWVLENTHVLRSGSWEHTWFVIACFAVAVISAVLSTRAQGRGRGGLIIGASLAFLAPFFQAGWGGLLFVAGVIGANVAGWVSQVFFQNRRAPAAGGLYGFLILCSIGMFFTLDQPGTTVATTQDNSQLQAGDKILDIAGATVENWSDVARTIACLPAKCVDSEWNAARCQCSTSKTLGPPIELVPSQGTIPVKVERKGQVLQLNIKDPLPEQRAGDKRRLLAQPKLSISPMWLGAFVFLMSLCVIGTHGLLSGTATMDFGGRKGAATAVGVIDGFVYLGTALQSVSLGYLTAKDWSYWPVFLLPFGIIGFALLTRIWSARPQTKK